MTNDNQSGALKGVRVIDLSRVLAGPFCTMLLADMGAEVIKVEEPGRGDDSRGYPPFLKGASAYFANLNRNKKSVILDLKKQEGKDLLRDLLKTADVLLENFKPGTMEKLGFGYDRIKEINPRLVYASISGFGQFGPYKDRPGYDIIGQAMGGLMSTTGWPDSPPTRTGTAMADIRTGVGERIDVALVDSVVSAMETIIQLCLVEGRIPGRIGNRYEFIAPYDSFAATDGWVVIGVGGEEVWKRFCKAIGREDLLNDPRFETNRDRVREYAPLKDIVTEWTSKRNAKDIISHLMSFSVPCAPIYNIEQIVNDPHIAQARGMIVEMDHPLEGTMKVVACPIKFTEMKPSIRSTAPLHGEHTEEVLTGLLGLSKEEVARLKEAGAVGG
jgi:crotonobetainyl-CoA:carnitine CoA-transferase CaiB-like acyl-CoA transferase